MVKWFRTASLRDDDLNIYHGKLMSDSEYQDPEMIIRDAKAFLYKFEQLFYDFKNLNNPSLGKKMTVSSEKIKWLWNRMETLYRERGGQDAFPLLDPPIIYTIGPEED